MLTDRQRVEIMLPAQIMLGVLICGANDKDHADYKDAQDALVAATDEALEGLLPEKKVQLIRRMHRAHLEVTEPYRKEGSRVDKMGLIAFYWLQALVEQEYLILHADSSMQRALDVMLPALEHAANIEKLDASAQKNSRKFLSHLQALGYYRGVVIQQGVAA